MKTLIACALIMIGTVAQGAVPAIPIFNPRPEYPVLARAKRITGSGVYVLRVDLKGRVVAVDVAVRSGSPILDNAAIKGFMRWKFKPVGAVMIVRMPLTWTLPGSHY